MIKSSPRADQFRADRARGMTYAQIANKHGVSKQRVGQVCGTKVQNQFRAISADGCVYKNLRNWMNQNQISRNELMRRMGFQTGGKQMDALRRCMKGISNPSKEFIDKMMEATGMSYEILFEVG